MKHFTIGRAVLALLASGALCLSLAPVASAGGGNSANAKLCQKGGWAKLYDADTGLHFTSRKDCIEDAANHEISSLTFTATVRNGFPVWNASGSGLEPLSSLSIFATEGGGQGILVGADGTASVELDSAFPCGSGLSAFAIATTSKGATITTPTLPSACG